MVCKHIFAFFRLVIKAEVSKSDCLFNVSVFEKLSIEDSDCLFCFAVNGKIAKAHIFFAEVEDVVFLFSIRLCLSQSLNNLSLYRTGHIIAFLVKHNRFSKSLTLTDKPFVLFCRIVREGIAELRGNFHIKSRKVSTALS